MKAALITIVILIILGVIYYFFQEKINRFFGIGTIGKAPEWVSCKETFFVKLPDGKTQSVGMSSNQGTTDNPIYFFTKNDVTFTEEGIIDAKEPIKISKSEYEALCKYLYNPPYAWYTATAGATGATGHGRTTS